MNRQYLMLEAKLLFGNKISGAMKNVGMYKKFLSLKSVETEQIVQGAW